MRRAALQILAGVMTLGLVLGVAGYPVFVRPQTDQPRPADAILVLGGTASAQRYLTGLDLAADGVAPTLVLSNPYRPRDPVLDALCAQQQPGFAVVCFTPEPRTTLGEGRELRRLAAGNGWRSVVVVTSTPHVSRARYIIGKCFDGELIMVGTPARLSVVDWAWLYAYHGAAYVKSWLQGQC